MLQNTEHMEEIYRPLSVPSVNDVLSGEKIVEIEQAMVGQAESPLWHGIRKGRITASNFYKVKTSAQLVEHRTGIAEVMGLNPVEALIFFRLLLSNCLNWKIYCDDHTSLSLHNSILVCTIEHQKYRVLLIINSDMRSFLWGWITTTFSMY